MTATPPRAAPAPLMVAAAFAAIYLIWGSTYLAIKYAIESVPPFLMTGARFLVAGAVLYAWSMLRPRVPACCRPHPSGANRARVA